MVDGLKGLRAAAGYARAPAPVSTGYGARRSFELQDVEIRRDLVDTGLGVARGALGPDGHRSSEMAGCWPLLGGAYDVLLGRLRVPLAAEPAPDVDCSKDVLHPRPGCWCTSATRRSFLERSPLGPARR